jgi:hypothetical protein
VKWNYFEVDAFITIWGEMDTKFCKSAKKQRMFMIFCDFAKV